MDPIIGGSLISAGSSLLGGLFGGDAPSAGDNFKSHMKAVMKMSERFKFNPLTLLGVSPMAGSASPNYMGSAIADAGLALADGMQRKAANDSRIQELEKEKEELQKKVVDLTIRPKVGGIYSGNHMVPSLRQALGVPDGQGASVVSQVQRSADARDITSPAGTDRLGWEAPFGFERGAAGENTKSPVVPDPNIKGGHDFYLGGIRFESSPDTTSPAVMEELGGEPAGWAWSIPWSIDTARHNVNRLGRKAMSWLPDGRYGAGDLSDRISVDDHPFPPLDWKPRRKPKKQNKHPLRGLGFQ